MVFNEYRTLTDIKNCLVANPSIDIDTYKLLDGFIENPYNISFEELKQIEDYINENTKVTKDFSVYYNKQELANNFKHIGPYKLALPITKVRDISFKKESIPSGAEIISIDFKGEVNDVSEQNVNSQIKVLSKAA